MTKIVNIRRMTKREADKEGWDIFHKAAPVLVLDDGSKIYPSSDEEGNRVGALFGIDKKGEHFVVTPSASKKKLRKVC